MRAHMIRSYLSSETLSCCSAEVAVHSLHGFTVESREQMEDICTESNLECFETDSTWLLMTSIGVKTFLSKLKTECY